jgi:hypothetical protein
LEKCQEINPNVKKINLFIVTHHVERRIDCKIRMQCDPKEYTPYVIVEFDNNKCHTLKEILDSIPGLPDDTKRFFELVQLDYVQIIAVKID